MSRYRVHVRHWLNAVTTVPQGVPLCGRLDVYSAVVLLALQTNADVAGGPAVAWVLGRLPLADPDIGLAVGSLNERRRRCSPNRECDPCVVLNVLPRAVFAWEHKWGLGANAPGPPRG